MRDPFAALDRYNQRAVEWQNARQARHGDDLGPSLRRSVKVYAIAAGVFALLKFLLEDALGGWLWAALLVAGGPVCFGLLVAADRRRRRAWERSNDASTESQ